MISWKTMLSVSVAAAAASAAALTPGWDNINPDRKEFPPQKVLWRADLDAAKLELRGGAEGTMRVVTGADGRRRIEIVKKNDRGTMIVTAPPYTAKKGAKLRVCAYCECEDGDPEDGYAYLRMYGKKEDLSYFKGLDKRRPGGPMMKNMVNSAPGTRIRKLAHRIADEKTGTRITAAIVVSGPPSTSLWSDWSIEDFNASVKAWESLLDSLAPADLSAGMQSEEDFEKDIAAERDHTARVERRDGYTRLIVDGEEVPPVIFRGSAGFRGSEGGKGRTTFAGGLHVKNGLDIQAITVRFGGVPGKKSGCWSEKGFDAAAGAAGLRSAMRLAPGAKFLVTMKLSAYPGYADEHPDEVWRLQDGRAVFGGSEHIPYSLPAKRGKGEWNWISMHSLSWHRDTKSNISAFVDELKRQGLAKRVIGFHLSGFHDAQFATRQPDFSAPARAAFREWQKKRFGEVKWQEPPETFGNEEILNPDDPVDAHRLAWIRFQKQQPFHTLEDFARHAKACFGKDVIAVRYCMSWGAAAFNGALDVDPFLTSDVFDALIAQPSYTHRIPGVAIGTRMPTASFHLNGKLFINEFDLRTYGGTAGREDELFTMGLSKAIDFPMWQSIHHKVAGQMIAQRMGWWYCDMSGTWFSPPEIVADIAEVRSQVAAAEGAGSPWRNWRSPVAVVVDEDGMLLRNSMAHYYALDEYAIQNQMRILAGSGVPYDTIVLNDLLRHPETYVYGKDGSTDGRYRVLFIADMHHVDAVRRKLLDNLGRCGVRVFLFDPKKRVSAREFAKIVREAGGYVPTRDGLQVDMSGVFLSVHALKGGHYDFRLPEPMAVHNMKDGSLAANGPTLPIDVVAGETCWFRLGPFVPQPRGVGPIDPAGWKARRGEVLETFREKVFGPPPETAKPVFSTLPDRPVFGGAGLHREGRVTAESKGGRLDFPVHAYIPKSSARVPAVINIYLGQRWKKDSFAPRAESPGGGSFPVRAILDRGVAAVTFRNCDVVDDCAGAKRVDCATIAAWAWAASRALDWALVQPEIDPGRIAVVGHSRGGKTALWAAACDERFALAGSNDSGCCGAKLNHVDLPRSEHFERILKSFGFWFCDGFAALAGRDADVGFDQHELLALVAPRRLVVHSASLDVNAGPAGEFLAARMASPAWEAYGMSGIPASLVAPPPDKAVGGGGVVYYMRTGKHDLVLADWNQYVDALLEMEAKK